MNRKYLAYYTAKAAHNGQFRKDGITPYFEHPKAVAKALTTESEKIVGYLHDVIEDTPLTIDDILVHLELTSQEKEALLLLTHDSNVPYNEYIDCISTNKLATAVKIQDILHNLSDNPTYHTAMKYLKSLEVLIPTMYQIKD